MHAQPLLNLNWIVLIFFLVFSGNSPAFSKPLFSAESDYVLELPRLKTEAVSDMTVKDAVLKAITGNHDIIIEKITVAISNTDIKNQEGQFDPSFQLTAANTRTNDVDASDTGSVTTEWTESGEISKKFSTGTEVSVAYNTTDNRLESSTGRYSSNLKLTITQDLLKNFGTDINRTQIMIARKKQATSIHDYQQKISEIIAEVQGVYWDFYKNANVIAVRKEAYDRTRLLLSNKRKEAKKGAIAYVDLLEIESDLASNISDYSEAFKNARESELSLRALLGLPMETTSQISGINPVSAPDTRPINTDFDRIANRVLSFHQGYLSLIQKKEAKIMESAYYRNQLLPSLEARFGAGLNKKSNQWSTSARAYDGGDEYSAQISLTIPIGNRSAKATLQKTDLELKQIIAQLKQKEASIKKDIQLALIELELARVQVQSEKTNIMVKEKNLMASNTKLTLGTGTLRGLLDRQRDLSDASLRLLEAQINYQKALIMLYKAQGRIDPDLGIDISFTPSTDKNKGFK